MEQIEKIELGAMPNVGDKVTIDGQTITVRKVDRKGKVFWAGGRKFKVAGLTTVAAKQAAVRERRDGEYDLKLKSYLQLIEAGKESEAFAAWADLVGMAAEFQRRNPAEAFPKAPEWQIRLIEKLKAREARQ
jgi:hypothetical protein